MQNSQLSRFATFDDVEPEDLERFELLTGPRRSFVRGEQLRQEGQPSPEVFRLRSGWLACSMTTASGGRQITKIHLPGDLVGVPSIASETALETTEALSVAEVDVVPLETFGTVFRHHPRLAAMLFLWSQEERVRLMHQLVMIGREQAPRRVAAFYFSIYRRLRIGDPNLGHSFDAPLTQQDVADATGITTVHANRSLRTLRDRGILTVQDGGVTIHDPEVLEDYIGMSALPKRSMRWV